jgi:orotidine-5'-phosphate decarboxylase
MPSYSARLSAAIRRTGNPVCVGLDPRWNNLPPQIRERAVAAGGNLWEQKARGFEEFSRRIIDVVAGLVPVVKPQAAFFEECGPAGVAALWRVMRHARSTGLLVICDAKRGDIGSTAEAYAQAYLGDDGDGPGQGGVDALTINPYLGADTLQPFVDAAVQHERGLYVLVRTSNPGAGTLQDICDVSQTKIYQHVARLVERLAESTRGAEPYGCVGGVVGATYPAELVELRQAMPHTPLLIPGYGSQGAKAADVAAGFGPDGVGAVVNSSRAIIFAHEKKEYAAKFPAERWEEAVRAATHDMIRELAPYCQPRPAPA